MDDAHADPLRSPGIRPYERELAMLGHLVTRPDHSLIDPAGAHAGQHRWQLQHDHLAGLRADELDAALHLGLAEHRRRHSRHGR
jgi:hypothetical protein